MLTYYWRMSGVAFQQLKKSIFYSFAGIFNLLHCRLFLLVWHSTDYSALVGCFKFLLCKLLFAFVPHISTEVGGGKNPQGWGSVIWHSICCVLFQLLFAREIILQKYPASLCRTVYLNACLFHVFPHSACTALPSLHSFIFYRMCGGFYGVFMMTYIIIMIDFWLVMCALASVLSSKLECSYSGVPDL